MIEPRLYFSCPTFVVCFHLFLRFSSLSSRSRKRRRLSFLHSFRLPLPPFVSQTLDSYGGCCSCCSCCCCLVGGFFLSVLSSLYLSFFLSIYIAPLFHICCVSRAFALRFLCLAESRALFLLSFLLPNPTVIFLLANEAS